MTEGTDPPLTAEPGDSHVGDATRALRRVAQALLRAGPHADDLDEVTVQLDEMAQRLEHRAPTLEERMRDMWAGEGVTRHDPVTGPDNVIAPPLTLYGRPDRWVSGTVTLGLLEQGPPGFVHGGIAALLLDHTLGVANHWGGATGMTARLTLAYRRPTPLHEPLEVRGRQTGVDGRRIHTEGEIRAADGEVCVHADGLFVSPKAPRPR